MRLQQVVELTKVNLLYANPQLIEKKRNKEGKSGRASAISGPMSVLMSSLFILVLFMFLYGFMLVSMDFSQYRGFFTIYVMMFSVMTILQGFYIIYNLFYESKDLEHYLPLPFVGSEIFAAKLVVVVLTVAPYLAPAAVIFYMTGRDTGSGILLSLLNAFLLFLLLMLVVFLLAVVFVHFITKLAFFQKNKKVATTVLYALSSIGMVAVIFFISNMTTDIDYGDGAVLSDYQPVPLVVGFYEAASQPFSLAGLQGMIFWLALLAVLGFFLYKWVIPGIYRASNEGTAVKGEKRKSKSAERASSGREPQRKAISKTAGKTVAAQQPRSVNQTLWKYNFGLIQDGTLMMQFLSSNIILPIFLIGPIFLNGLTLDQAPLYFWGLFFIAGFFYNFLTLNSISVVGVIISLDRENFLYMKSLPFSMRNYLRQKFLFAFFLQAVLPFIIATVLLVMAKAPLLLLFCFLCGLLAGLFTMCQFYFVRDYRFLNLDWQNLTELFGRGGGNFVQALIIFGTTIVGALVVTGFAFLLLSLGPIGRIVASLLMVLLPLSAAAALTYRYQKKFWPQFDE